MSVNIHLFCIKVSSEIEETASAEMADLVVCVDLHYRLPTICIRHTAGWVTGEVGSEACREGLLWLVNLQGHLPRLPLLCPRSANIIKLSGFRICLFCWACLLNSYALKRKRRWSWFGCCINNCETCTANRQQFIGRIKVILSSLPLDGVQMER